LKGKIKYPLSFSAKLHGTDYFNGFYSLRAMANQQRKEILNLMQG